MYEWFGIGIGTVIGFVYIFVIDRMSKKSPLKETLEQIEKRDNKIKELEKKNTTIQKESDYWNELWSKENDKRYELEELLEAFMPIDKVRAALKRIDERKGKKKK